MCDLHQTLKDLMAAIANGEDRVAPLISRVDELKQELAPEAPPMLQHYLDNRSYAKAIDFLEGRDEAQAPNC